MALAANGASSYWDSEGSGTVGLAHCSSSWEKERDSRFHLLLGSSKQGQSLISLQMKPAGAQLLAGAQPCPDTFPSSRMSSLQDLCHRTVAVGQGRELSPVPTCASCAPSLSHIVRLYSMPLLAEMPDQGSRLQRRLWACLYILWGMEHGLRLASVEPMCCR